MTTDQGAEQSVNGAQPEPAAPAATTPAEQVMGALAIVAALALLAVGLDMLTGGAVFRALGLGEPGEGA